MRLRDDRLTKKFGDQALRFHAINDDIRAPFA
jgi:hypothetical protein